MLKPLIAYLFLISVNYASGGFLNGTAVGKGKFRLDITINPFDQIKYGQSYFVLGYGITDKFNITSYVSRHPGHYYTAYIGGLYQFINTNRIDLSTGFGLRKRQTKDWTHIFFPQLLYTYKLNDRFSIMGSLVSINDYQKDKNFGFSNDIGFTYQTKYKSKNIDSISISLSLFHPVTWYPKTYFLPTYSIDFVFN